MKRFSTAVLGVEAESEAAFLTSMRPYIASLDQRLRDLLTAYYGLEDDTRQTLAQIAVGLGISANRVAQLHQRALRMLRRRKYVAETRAKLPAMSLEEKADFGIDGGVFQISHDLYHALWKIGTSTMGDVAKLTRADFKGHKGANALWTEHQDLITRLGF